MRCQICNQKAATVHVTEIEETSAAEVGGEPAREVAEQHLCGTCAQSLDLPYVEIEPKNVVNIWKLLKQTAQQTGGLACPDCGMTLAEFRSKGRVGCARDYEVFRQQIDPLLLRVHNATEHTGRVPGIGQEELDRLHALSELRSRLETAVREEDYEDAAHLRDEIQTLEGGQDES